MRTHISTVYLTCCILFLTAPVAAEPPPTPPKEMTREEAEILAKGLMREVCTNDKARAEMVAKIMTQESKYRVTTDLWDLDVACQQIDLPEKPVHDTADPAIEATHTSWVYDVRYSWDGRSIVSAGRDGTVRIWDVETGKQRLTIVADEAKPDVGAPESGITRQVAFVGDGSTVAAAGDNGPPRVFDVASGKALVTLPFTPREPGNAYATYLAATTDGLIYVGGTNDEVLAIDSATNAIKYKLPGHGEQATAIAVSEPHRLVATGGVSKERVASVQLWKLENGEKIGEIRDVGHDWPKLAFSRDGTQLAIGTDSVVKIYSIANKLITQTLKIHANYAAYDVAFTADGKGLISCQSHPILWDIATARLIRHFGPFSDLCHGIDVSPDGKYAVTGSMGSDVRVWEIATGAFHRRLGTGVKPPR